MPVNPSELVFYTKLLKQSSEKIPKPLGETTLTESRASIASIEWLARKEASTPYIDTAITSRDKFNIPIRIYNYDASRDMPVFIYLTGNGYIYDLFKINCSICSNIAQLFKGKVVSINIRLAPEHPLPMSIYDAYDVIKYLFNYPEQFNINATKIILGGFCSGATSAVGIAELAYQSKDFSLNHLILLNGIYDITFKHKEYLQYENNDISFTEDFLNYVIKKQNIPLHQHTLPLYSPLYSQNLSNIPPTTIIVAEYDRNRSSSEAFYLKLISSNVLANKIILPGQVHNTILFPYIIKKSLDPINVISHLLIKSID